MQTTQLRSSLSSDFALKTERLGPLPLINHFLERMGLEELLEQYVPTSDRRCAVAHARVLGVLLRSIVVEREPIYRQQESVHGFASGLYGLNARQPMNNYASTMSGAKPLGISDTNNRPGTMSPSNGVQQAGAMQGISSTASGQSPSTAAGDNSSPMGTVPSFDQGGQVVSRPMPNSVNSTPSSGPVPPPPPGGYTIPAPSAYTPPTNSTVPTRKPGDDL